MAKTTLSLEDLRDAEDRGTTWRVATADAIIRAILQHERGQRSDDTFTLLNLQRELPMIVARTKSTALDFVAQLRAAAISLEKLVKRGLITKLQTRPSIYRAEASLFAENSKVETHANSMRPARARQTWRQATLAALDTFARDNSNVTKVHATDLARSALRSILTATESRTRHPISYRKQTLVEITQIKDSPIQQIGSYGYFEFTRRRASF